MRFQLKLRFVFWLSCAVLPVACGGGQQGPSFSAPSDALVIDSELVVSYAGSDDSHNPASWETPQHGSKFGDVAFMLIGYDDLRRLFCYEVSGYIERSENLGGMDPAEFSVWAFSPLLPKKIPIPLSMGQFDLNFCFSDYLPYLSFEIVNAEGVVVDRQYVELIVPDRD